MAINKVPTGSVLKLVFNVGIGNNGNPVFRTKSLNNVKSTATDQDLFDVAATVADMMDYTLSGISRVDNAQLAED
ncbi:MAG: DUF1659 domain-containing protein [Desulfotomaculaceae bacterium]|nr:DUF1659 domain-containing protein [Desulfotomaculaceae bacterium]